MEDVVIGIDVGGTATRALVATLAGQHLGSGRAGAANPQVQPPQVVARALAKALRQALSGLPPMRVRGGVLGLAGYGATGLPEVTAAIDGAWAGAGLDAPLRIEPDAVVAFAAGTPAPAGAVVIAGTGAVAARIAQRRITRTVDGLGWLLGDDGSGFWLGRAAARATARALAAGAPPTRLTREVTAYIGANDRDSFVTRCYQQPRDRLAGLAPVVCAAAAAGDPTADEIVAQAAACLAASVTELGELDGPVVLAGGLLTNPTPVRDRLRERLAGGPVPVQVAGEGVAGAAWLAALHAGAGETAPDHDRFRSG